MSAETLRSLAAAVAGTVRGDGAVEVSDVTHDSRQAGPGVLFVAIPGENVDGHDFVDAAVEAGSPAVAVQHHVTERVPELLIANTRARLGRLAARAHGNPSSSLDVVGITGTNGKTTVAHLLESVFMAAGIASGRIGTTGARSGSSAVDIGFTTPEASDLHRLFAAMLLDGVESVAMEVSSHALALGRVEDVEFAAAAFTNLSQDHLDFHGSMEDYFAAKRELFFRAPTAVINIGDTWGERLAGQAPSSLDIMTVGLGGDLSARDVVSTIDGSTFTWLHGGSAGTARVPLAGSFNVENALVATGLALVMGLTPGAIEAGLAACPPVPGRFEVVRGERGTIVVDYAHTPEAIAKTVAAARQLTTGRLVAVFGAGGDRDRDKRPLMGAAACAADLAILTNDNPRSEDPEAIAEQVRAGMTGACDVVVELDRRAAIELAVGRANPGDTVLLLGKGHEPGQAFADHTEPFDDRAEAARVLEVVG